MSSSSISHVVDFLRNGTFPVPHLIQGLDLRRCYVSTPVPLEGIRFENCDLRSADFVATNLRGVIFENCNMNSARLNGAILEDTQFLDCDVSEIQFHNVHGTSARIKNCRASALSIRSSLNGVLVLDSVQIQGNLRLEECSHTKHTGEARFSLSDVTAKNLEVFNLEWENIQIKGTVSVNTAPFIPLLSSFKRAMIPSSLLALVYGNSLPPPAWRHDQRRRIYLGGHCS